jgi:hypothetical protein
LNFRKSRISARSGLRLRLSALQLFVLAEPWLSNARFALVGTSANRCFSTSRIKVRRAVESGAFVTIL